MRNKIIISILLVCILVAALSLFVACGDKEAGLTRKSGKDQYGREYGQTYDIDSEESGVYAAKYEISDTSSTGKRMITQFCYDEVKVQVSASGITLTFYCLNTSFSDVKLDGEEGRSVNEDNLYGYAFEVTREALNGKMAMTGKVAMMNREVAFSITVDLTQAELIG